MGSGSQKQTNPGRNKQKLTGLAVAARIRQKLTGLAVAARIRHQPTGFDRSWQDWIAMNIKQQQHTEKTRNRHEQPELNKT
jgi:hypothetical protein